MAISMTVRELFLPLFYYKIAAKFLHQLTFFSFVSQKRAVSECRMSEHWRPCTTACRSVNWTTSCRTCSMATAKTGFVWRKKANPSRNRSRRWARRTGSTRGTRTCRKRERPIKFTVSGREPPLPWLSRVPVENFLFLFFFFFWPQICKFPCNWSTTVPRNSNRDFVGRYVIPVFLIKAANPVVASGNLYFSIKIPLFSFSSRWFFISPKYRPFVQKTIFSVKDTELFLDFVIFRNSRFCARKRFGNKVVKNGCIEEWSSQVDSVGSPWPSRDQKAHLTTESGAAQYIPVRKECFLITKTILIN